MNILLISSIRINGGGEHNLRLLAKLLSRVYQVKLVVPIEMENFYNDTDAELILYRFPQKSWLKGTIICKPDSFLINLVSWSDVCHCYCVDCIPLLVGSKREKIIWTCHGHWEVSTLKKAQKIDNIVGKVLFVSNSVKNKVCYGVFKNSKILHLGLQINSTLILKKPALSQDINLISVGRFQYIKGQDLLLRALLYLNVDKKINVNFYGGVSKKYKDRFYLTLCVLLARMISLVKKNIKIVFHGHIKNPFDNRIYENSINVVPSRYESFSLVTVEGLAKGIPAIVPSNTGAAEIIKNNVYGTIFIPGNKASLIFQLENFKTFNDFKKDDLVERSKEFDISVQVEKLIQFYRECNEN